MRLLVGCVALLCPLGLFAGVVRGGGAVFPGERWHQATPESQGVAPAKLKEAIDYGGDHFGLDGAKELVIRGQR